MRKLVITLLAGAGALFAGSAANATEIYTSSEYASSEPAARATRAYDL
jgi:hypothetical protein